MIARKLLIGAAALALTLPAQADIIVALEPSAQTTSIGNSITVDLVISGLGDHSSPSLGGFDFDLKYSPREPIFKPIRKQLGLSLEPADRAIEVVVAVPDSAAAASAQ